MGFYEAKRKGTRLKAQRLEPLSLPLYGSRLIEASAGTGKTYTITVLYLRLLLGLGGPTAFFRPLTAREILVVTFTEAATAELRRRIRQGIHSLRIACIRGGSDDPLFAALISQISNLQEATERLLSAEQDMDDAAIFTIHGFCQRILNTHVLESGLLLEKKLLEDETALYRQAAIDFWRRYCYPLSTGIASEISRHWRSPEHLLKQISPWLQTDHLTLKYPPKADETIEQRAEKITRRINSLKADWRAVEDQLQPLVEQSGINKRSYSRATLPKWLEEISSWAKEETTDYQFPQVLRRFSQKILVDKSPKGNAPHHPIFETIEQFISTPLSLCDIVISQALLTIKEDVKKEKKRSAIQGFDDLLRQLDELLLQPNSATLATRIRENFPVALIDEFQDTDLQQYRIFRQIYVDKPQCALLFIGDPRQAIYAFRGADIFTYIRARSEIQAHYTLETNWRSSPAMVESVNKIFSLLDHPFLYKAIPFTPVEHAPLSEGRCFLIKGKRQPALRFWLKSEELVNVTEYLEWAARQCASQILHWLESGQSGNALLGKKGSLRPVQASDIAVLVRSHREAKIMRNALKSVKIPSVYLSGQDSVFNTSEARDLLCILQAIVAPEQEQKLRTALATSLLGLDAVTIDAMGDSETTAAEGHENDRTKIKDAFMNWLQIWRKRGILPMLRAMMIQRRIAENLLASEDGERRLTDLLHLGELLQETSGQIDTERGLVVWLAQQVVMPNSRADNQQLRLESEYHLVKIVTIHKSKGLEYPLVCLPFLANFRENSSSPSKSDFLYHEDSKNFPLLLDLHGDEESREQAEKERLAEDMRLLYVAMTRSIYHCGIGIAPLLKRSSRKEGPSDLHKSALGYLVQSGQTLGAKSLRGALEAICTDHNLMETVISHDIPQGYWQPLDQQPPNLRSATVLRKRQENWRMTSYSALQASHTLDVESTVKSNAKTDELTQTVHSFPRGASTGTFLHHLFETIAFSQPLMKTWLEKKLRYTDIEKSWLPVLEHWITQVLNCPLHRQGIRLNKLLAGTYQKEMAFCLPICTQLTPKHLNRLISHYDPLSARAPVLHFQDVQGMLTGVIDLCFCWEGKYYLLDYKSNWLGETMSAYNQDAIEAEMMAHRYDVQYQFYTLAFHRYLQSRITDYDYEHHFGGVFYLFLRGMVDSDGKNGVFYTRPSAEFIMALDNFFSDKQGIQ